MRMVTKSPLRPQVGYNAGAGGRNGVAMRGGVEAAEMPQAPMASDHPQPVSFPGRFPAASDAAGLAPDQLAGPMHPYANVAPLKGQAFPQGAPSLPTDMPQPTPQQQHEAAALLNYWNMCSIYSSMMANPIMVQQRLQAMYAHQTGAGWQGHGPIPQGQPPNPGLRVNVPVGGGMPLPGGPLPVHAAAAVAQQIAAAASGMASPKLSGASPKGKGRSPRAKRQGGCAGSPHKVCSNCGTSTTPFWRKAKHNDLYLCNACGLYFSKNGASRPKELWLIKGQA